MIPRVIHRPRRYDAVASSRECVITLSKMQDRTTPEDREPNGSTLSLRITVCTACQLRQRRSRLGHCIREGCRAKLPAPSDRDERLDPASIIPRPQPGQFVFRKPAATVPPPMVKATAPAITTTPSRSTRLTSAVTARIALAQEATASAMSRADSFAQRWKTILRSEGRRAAKRLFATDPMALAVPVERVSARRKRLRQAADRLRAERQSRSSQSPQSSRSSPPIT